MLNKAVAFRQWKATVVQGGGLICEAAGSTKQLRVKSYLRQQGGGYKSPMSALIWSRVMPA
jgi:hypothetical protein